MSKLEKTADWKDDEFVTISEAAAWIGWSVSNYYKRAKQGVAPKPVKFGKSSRISTSELKAMKTKAFAARDMAPA